MFKVVNHKKIKWPRLYPKVEREDPTIKSKGWDRVGDFTLRDKVDLMPQKGLQEAVCSCDSNLIFMCGSMSMGKAQPYDAKVLTPDGFVYMGSLIVGDTICDTEGGTQKVLAIFEQGERLVYRLRFDDGSETECCAEHLWPVLLSNNSKGYTVKEFSDLISLLDKGFYIPMPLPKKTFANSKELPFAAYKIGVALAKNEFSKEQIDEILLSKVEDRLEILKGIVDTIGFFVRHQQIKIETSQFKLAKTIQYLVKSLGGRCSLTLANDFAVLIFKKSVLYATDDSCCNRKLIKYEIVGKKQCRCILVSNPNHLYITDDFIVTHNTYCMYLSQLYGITKQSYSGVMISVRAADSKKGTSIYRDAVEVLGKFAECEVTSSDSPTFFWPQWNSSVRLIHSNFNADNKPEWEEFKDYAKKVQASYIAIDEATEIKQFKMFTYWFGRNRDSSGNTPQMVLSFNPEHEHWTTQMIKDAGYLNDDWFIKPEMIGKTKYFYIKGDSPESIIWGDTPEEVAQAANIVLTEKDKKAGATYREIVKSFTLFTGEAADNLKLVAATQGQSLGNLHAVGGTQRSIVKGAYFGPIDKEECSVSRQMVQNLWTNPIDNDRNMYATLDVSSGGTNSDRCPMVIWKGLQIVNILFFSGKATELVEWIHKTLNEYDVPITNFAFDATGIGNYLKDFTAGMPVTANLRAIQEIDAYGNPVQLEQYFNLRSQLLGKMRVMFEKGEISCALSRETVMPCGRKGESRQFINILYDEINIFVSTERNKKIYFKSKEEYKSRYKRSPDLMDAIVLRAIFELDARPKKQPLPQTDEDVYEELYKIADDCYDGWEI